MTDLITDLESAAEGSRALSDRVLRACGWEQNPNNVGVWNTPPGSEDLPNYVRSDHRPDPTRNLQDAVAMVPEGWWPGLDPIFFDVAGVVKFGAILCRPDWDRWNPVNSDWIERLEARGQTPPLAVCIAILKGDTEKLEKMREINKREGQADDA